MHVNGIGQTSSVFNRMSIITLIQIFVQDLVEYYLETLNNLGQTMLNKYSSLNCILIIFVWINISTQLQFIMCLGICLISGFNDLWHNPRKNRAIPNTYRINYDILNVCVHISTVMWHQFIFRYPETANIIHV